MRNDGGDHALREEIMAGTRATEFLDYLVQRGSAGERLPAITDLANQLGVSTSKLREQLEVARALGLVEVRPKTGIRVLPYSFFSSIRTSLRFALALDRDYFEQIGKLRNHIEESFWEEAVRLLLPEDKARLEELVRHAWAKLRGQPIQIPHTEHRDLHLTIYSRLENEFVYGLLEAYWEAYEATGLDLYADYSYLEEVWTYHQRMVEALIRGDLEAGHRALVEHTGLLQHRPGVHSLAQPDLEHERASMIEPRLVEESER